MKTLVWTLLVLAVVGCGGAAAKAQPAAAPTSTSALTSPTPTRDPSRDGMPLMADVSARGTPHSFMGGDDHVTLGITNRGRDVQDLVIDTGTWLYGHTIAMGTSAACNVDPANQNLLDCGPVYSGEQRSFSIKAFPEDSGNYHYEMRFFSRENGQLVPIVDASGVQQVAVFDEVVDAQGNQVQGYNPPVTPTAKP